MNQEYDLLIYGGRLIDPAQHIDAPRDIAIQAGKVAAVDQQLPHGHARQLYDATGRVVTPGLIDLHTHVFKGLHIAVDADAVGRNSGVTTMVDTGSSGAANFSLFRDHIIPKTKVRIIPFLNIWITGDSMSTLPGETHFDGVDAAAREGREPPKVLCYFDDVRYASCEAALATI